MDFSEVIGHRHLKKHFIQSINEGRVPHAQLFIGPEGSGTLPMALAYAQYLLCRDNESCIKRFKNSSHPDLHFAYPVFTTKKVKSKPVSKFFTEEWRKLIKEEPYGNLFDWYKILGVDNKQGLISIEEAKEIIKSLSLKSYGGGYKVIIIWMAEKMNTECANRLLKLIEEPPNQTVFLLVAENEELIISTIRSRCQTNHLPPLSELDITQALVKNYDLEENKAKHIAHQSSGNYNKACDLVFHDSEDRVFEQWFVLWVRSAFKAKGNKAVIHSLISWSETIAKSGRETQKQFLRFCQTYFRQALLLNYSVDELVFIEPKVENFKLEKFAPFVHDANILGITSELENAIYHIERNGNAKIIFIDLSIKLTRLLHKKSQANT